MKPFEERTFYVALVRLNRPPVNALSEELNQDLAAAFDRCADSSIRAVVHPMPSRVCRERRWATR